MLKYDQNNSQQGNRAKKQKKKKFRWWYILIAVLALILIAVAAVYFNVSSRLDAHQGYTNGWSQIKTDNKISDSALNSDDGDFSNLKGQNYPIIKIAQKDPDVENILIIGTDGTDTDSGHRSDTMIVASMNKKTNTLKLMSIMRDIKAYFPDRKSWNKINAAYAYGGAGQCVNIINYNFKLDIQKYITMNFTGFQDIINAAGGVNITVTSKEAAQIPGLKSAGTYKLSGTQALAYSRIRHIDSDFVRVQRQRTVITSLYNQFKAVGIPQKTSVANTCLNYVKTNIPTTELMGTMLSFSSAMKGDIAQYTVPASDLYTSVSSPIYFINVNWDKQLPLIKQFIWGN